ncbi:hypothetical protein FQN60_003656 [Etheostoma spectabile]|uniref:BTB domain-containing protein n=1 Tax=Etheostoma spectabile TaxID=54343 RepID=A0A5J5CRU9_9PERO|nr:hypothetical protein FQN60_003656 [Etheostoma spectabile]
MSAEASVGSHAADSTQSAVSPPVFHNTDELRNRGLIGSKYVKLNVGGSLHYTTVQTLSKEDSLLRSICNGGTEVSIDSEGWVVLDRCGRHFGLVLNFLRDGSVPLPEEHRELDEVLKEAQYYRVQGLVQHCLSAMQKQKDVFETVCRIPMITSAKEEQKMIASCRKPVVKLQNNRGNNKYSYTSNSDDNLLKNIELFDKLVLRFNGRVLFVKDVLGDEICCWSFYGEGRKIAEVCCTSIVYATEKKQTKTQEAPVHHWELRRRAPREETGESDGSTTLTLGILKRRYLAHVGCKSISPEARNVMKQVVEEELMKMQESDESGSELETAKPRNKRKRDKEKDEVKSGKENGDDESRAKKSRRQSTSSSESEDKDGRETGSEEEAQIKSESEDAEQEVKNSKEVKNGNSKQQINSEESSDEDMNKSEKKGNESDCDDSPKEMGIRRANATKTGGTRSRNTSQGKTPQSDEENETDTDSKSQKSEKNNSNDSSEEKVSVEKKDDDPESDSSSLPSIDDEKNSGKESSQGDKKKKKEKSDKGQKQGDKAVVRLKRYISLCGLRPIYKKLLDGCRSVRSQVDLNEEQPPPGRKHASLRPQHMCTLSTPALTVMRKPVHTEGAGDQQTGPTCRGSSVMMQTATDMDKSSCKSFQFFRGHFGCGHSFFCVQVGFWSYKLF